jgi:hypothetical protein
LLHFFEVHEVQESFKDIQKKIQAWTAWMLLDGLDSVDDGRFFFLPCCPLLRSMKILAGIGRSTWLMRPASGLQVLCAGQFAVFVSKAMNHEIFTFDVFFCRVHRIVGLN